MHCCECGCRCMGLFLSCIGSEFSSSFIKLTSEFCLALYLADESSPSPIKAGKPLNSPQKELRLSAGLLLAALLPDPLGFNNTPSPSPTINTDPAPRPDHAALAAASVTAVASSSPRLPLFGGFLPDYRVPAVTNNVGGSIF